MNADHDPYAALRYRSYRYFLIGSFLSNLGRQALTVAAEWQIYEWTQSATALGLVGLINVVPLIALALPAGTLADRADRKKILTNSLLLSTLISAGLALLTLYGRGIPDAAPLHWANHELRNVALIFERHVNPATLHFDRPALPLLYLLLFIEAAVRVTRNPARATIVPLLMPPESLSNAITWSSSAFELASMAGPALGGFVIAFGGYDSVYFLDAAACLTMAALLLGVHYTQPEKPPAVRSLKTMLAGAEFIWNRKTILAASSLDLFAVLLGGAVALLPIYADKILHVGPIGLGWLRAAPAFGSAAMALALAHLPSMRRPGVMLLWAVAGFGVAVVIFGFSTWFWLSLLALFFTGVFDNVSVVVRQSLVQLLTPDALRGRVTAVNQIFIGSSNAVGALRAGLMAALFGPVFAAVFGGFGTIAVVAWVGRKFPQLQSLAALHTLRPEE